MLISAILVALIAIENLVVVQPRNHPYMAVSDLGSFLLVAVAMGEPVLGMKAAAYIQLTYLG